MERFAQILYDLGKEIGVELYPDPNHVCQLNYLEKLHIQLEYDETSEEVLISCFVCEIPAGKFRENLLKEGLSYNANYPRLGTFAYSEKNNQFTLFERVHVTNLKPEKLFQLLEAFIDIVTEWKDAVEQGKNLPTTGGSDSSGSSMFGLKP